MTYPLIEGPHFATLFAIISHIPNICAILPYSRSGNIPLMQNDCRLVSIPVPFAIIIIVVVVVVVVHDPLFAVTTTATAAAAVVAATNTVVESNCVTMPTK